MTGHPGLVHGSCRGRRCHSIAGSESRKTRDDESFGCRRRSEAMTVPANTRAAPSPYTPEGGDTGGSREVEVSISIRTILLVGAAVAVAWALASVADVLLTVFVAVFCVAVLLPVVGKLERLGWSRRLACTVL